MQLRTIIFLAFGLAMDAFAVAITNGISYKKYSKYQILATAAAFGLFQGMMPLLGFLAGSTVSHLMEGVAHIVALVLLVYLGGRMIWDALREIRHPDDFRPRLEFTWRRLISQAVATSVDALAVGVTLAALSVDIIPAVAAIGAVTFGCALCGVWLGRRFGRLLGSRAALAGGGILVVIGLKIFFEHVTHH